MSALVRYFLFKGKVVAGYDRTPSLLTETLIAEGAQIHYEENVDFIPEACKDKEATLVIEGMKHCTSTTISSTAPVMIASSWLR